MPQHERAGSRPENEQSEEALAEQQERLFHWYGATLNARFWLDLAAIDAAEAAQLLSGEMPKEDSATWLEATSWVDHAGGQPLMTPQQRGQLLRGFQDVGGKRQLVDWLRIAQTRFWRYDPWIDQYLEAAKDRAERLQQSIAQAARDLTEAETAAADATDRLHAVKAKIDDWTRVATPTATDLKHKEEKLAQLQVEERMLVAAVKNLRGDFAEVDDVDLLQAVLDSGDAHADDAPPLHADELKAGQPVRVHSSKKSRGDIVDVVIAEAEGLRGLNASVAEMWLTMTQLIEGKGPLFAGIFAGDIRYRDNNGDLRTFSQRNLKDRLRNRRKSPVARTDL